MNHTTVEWQTEESFESSSRRIIDRCSADGVLGCAGYHWHLWLWHRFPVGRKRLGQEEQVSEGVERHSARGDSTHVDSEMVGIDRLHKVRQTTKCDACAWRSMRWDTSTLLWKGFLVCCCCSTTISFCLFRQKESFDRRSMITELIGMEEQGEFTTHQTTQEMIGLLLAGNLRFVCICLLLFVNWLIDPFIYLFII